MNDYKVERLLGKGSYGEVFLVKDSKYNYKAVKKMKMSLNIKEKKYLLYEIFSQLLHDCIYLVKATDVYQRHQKINIVTDYATYGDLSKVIKKHKISNMYIAKWTLQISSALLYLHYSSLIHRDVKTENIFLYSDKNVKLGDLGIMKNINNVGKNTHIGTPLYMPPESQSGLCNTSSDVWSLGCVIYELHHKKHPFDGRSLKELNFNIKFTKLTKYTCSKQWKVLIEAMLNKVPYQRPNLKQIILDPYINKVYPHFKQIELQRLDLSRCETYSKLSWNFIFKKIDIILGKAKEEKLPDIIEKEVVVPKKIPPRKLDIPCNNNNRYYNNYKMFYKNNFVFG